MNIHYDLGACPGNELRELSNECELELGEKKMKEKVEKILKHNINVFMNG